MHQQIKKRPYKHPYNLLKFLHGYWMLSEVLTCFHLKSYQLQIYQDIYLAKIPFHIQYCQRYIALICSKCKHRNVYSNNIVWYFLNIHYIIICDMMEEEWVGCLPYCFWYIGINSVFKFFCFILFLALTTSS